MQVSALLFLRQNNGSHHQQIVCNVYVRNVYVFKINLCLVLLLTTRTLVQALKALCA